MARGGRQSKKRSPSTNFKPVLRNTKEQPDLIDSEDEFGNAQDEILLEGLRQDARINPDDAEASDEEVLSISALNSSDESDSSGAEEEDGITDGWGDSKQQYYDADSLSNDEDFKAEEEEALRIQKQSLARLRAADYIDEFQDWKDTEDNEEDEAIETLPLVLSEDLSKEDLTSILKQRYPEFSSFALEFQRLHKSLAPLETLAKRQHHPQHDLINAKHNALRAYLTVLAFYFVVVSSDTSHSIDMKDHELMISLVRCRDAWVRTSHVSVDPNISDTIDSTQIAVEKHVQEPLISRKRKRPSKPKDIKIHAGSPELQSFAPESDEDLDMTLKSFKKLPRKKTSRSTERPDIADNVADSVDAEDAADRRKTLQFYASQINNKKARRNVAQSGDQDLPYRERRKEREARLQAEAERRKGGVIGADLDDEPTSAAGLNDEPDDEYYQLIASAAAQQKALKKQEHDDAVALVRAERAGYGVPEHLAEKRAIGRDIAANKGITTRKPKENRNARVKKRNKYEAAKKRLASQKAIFKQPTGSYGGEASGINQRVIKSTRLDGGSSKKR